MERDGLCLKHGKGAIDLALLVLNPFRLAARFVTEPTLIHLQNGCIHDAVGERLQSERCDAFGPCGNEFTAPCFQVETFNNDAGIVNHHAIIQNEGGDFAERILLANGIIGINRVGRNNFDLISEA